MSATAADFAADSAVAPLGGGLLTPLRHSGSLVWAGRTRMEGTSPVSLVRAMSAELAAASDRGPRSLTVTRFSSVRQRRAPLELRDRRRARSGAARAPSPGRDRPGRAPDRARPRQPGQPRRYEARARVGVAPHRPRRRRPSSCQPADLRALRAAHVQVRSTSGRVFGPAALRRRRRRPRRRLDPHARAAAARRLRCSPCSADAWFPSAFAAPDGALAGADARPHDPLPRPVLPAGAASRGCSGRSLDPSAAIDGLFEEDGELWSADRPPARPVAPARAAAARRTP